MGVHMFLDVDGVLNAVALNPPTWRPTGDPYERVRVNGFQITYSPVLIAWLNEVSKRPGVEFHWLTTWERDAPTLLAPAIGLDGSDWPVLGTDLHYSKEPVGAWWKHLAVIDHLAENEPASAVWIDDDISFEPTTRNWLDGHPKVRWISPATREGLTPTHIELLDGWLTTTTRADA